MVNRSSVVQLFYPVILIFFHSLHPNKEGVLSLERCLLSRSLSLFSAYAKRRKSVCRKRFVQLVAGPIQAVFVGMNVLSTHLNRSFRVRFKQHRAEAFFVGRAFPDLPVFDREMTLSSGTVLDCVNCGGSFWVFLRVPAAVFFGFRDEEMTVGGEPPRAESTERPAENLVVGFGLASGDFSTGFGVAKILRGWLWSVVNRHGTEDMAGGESAQTDYGCSTRCLVDNLKLRWGNGT
jgi:hypothetical protein